MKLTSIHGARAHVLSFFLASAMLPVLGQAAGYKFTTFDFPAEGFTVLTGIDDTNRVTGYVNLSLGGTLGFFATAAGSVATVNPPGYVSTQPAAINRAGGIVGTAYDGSNYVMFQDNVEGYGALSGLLLQQTVTGINASFDIVGTYQNPSLQTSVYARINGTYHALLPAKCSYTHDPGISDNGVVVGNCVLASNASLGFTWSKGKYTYFTPPSNVAYLQASAINNAGTIAGWYVDTSGFDHGFVYDGATFTTVDNPTAGTTSTQVLGINKAGRLVGTFTATHGMEGFIAIPQ
jgi:hypothetical protein